jgi:hypothetical protein
MNHHYLDAVIGFIFLAAVVAFVAHLFRLGDIYIEFDGRRYYVWQRAFLGYDDCRGSFNTEKEARAFIEELARNPPRTIKP